MHYKFIYSYIYILTSLNSISHQAYSPPANNKSVNTDVLLSTILLTVTAFATISLVNAASDSAQIYSTQLLHTPEDPIEGGVR